MIKSQQRKELHVNYICTCMYIYDRECLPLSGLCPEYFLKLSIRESVDCLCRDGADIHRKSLHLPEC